MQTDIDRIAAEFMDNMVSVWREGNLSKYLEQYKPSEDLIVTFSGVMIKGHVAFSQLLQQSYTRETMGVFKMSIHTATPLGERAILIVGDWEHQFPDALIGGGFSFVIETEQDGVWQIIHDHTSRNLKQYPPL